MKIIKTWELTEGQTGFELSAYPSVAFAAEFYAWTKEHELENVVSMRTFYTAEFGGDMDHPAIILAKGAPEEIKTLCILRWS
jgi:hypothetical protein